ncbi:energy transducer TonB [Campylobacter sp. MIT 99-7217]|uniref:TonB C-terminal domain-containing protein n=1 Tax=Campylobacter sp. MIT 99-7217 TaxID=535091 RepID=UPI0011570E27|nr:TonB C-terminal domain-containing protein [Campylobacter sp. MIT 99-7217]TQR30319.1 energy transducer TonB [Campylobacter sp. MIT 99-7217]
MKDYGLGSLNAFLLSLLVYMGLVFFIFFKIASDYKSIVNYTDIKDSFIDVDLGSFTPKTPTQNNQEKENPAKEQEKQGQETTNKAVETKQEKQSASNINSLFGNLKDFQEEQSTAVQSSAKSTPKASSQKSASELFKQLNDNLIPENTPQGESSQKQKTGIYDQFLGSVKRKLEENWGLYQRSGNFAVELKFFIDSNGKFGYTSVSKSYNEEFDNKVLEFLKNLEGKFIVYPPDGRYEGQARLSDEILMEVRE